MLFRNTGDPQVAICLNIARLNLGLANLKSAFFITNGSIAATEHKHIDIDVASADPTTSIPSTKRKNVRNPIVIRFDAMFITMLVFTNPLILR